MKLFVMGGINATNISEMFTVRSSKTVKVDYSINKFSTSISELRSTRVNVDRMVIYLDPSINYQKELNTLMTLLADEDKSGEYKKNLYFSVNEIYIFLTESEESEDIKRLYTQSLNKLTFIETRITVSKRLVLSDIFNNVMQTKSGKEFKNKYKSIYAYDRNNKARYSYDEEVYNGIIEPFDMSAYDNYRNMKELVSRAETGANRLEDETRNTGLGNGESVYLGRLKSNQLYSSRGFIDIFTGVSNSGTSTLLTSVTQNYVAEDKKLIVIDYSKTQDTIRLFEEMDIERVTMKICKARDLFFGGATILKDNDIVVFSVEDNIEASTIFIIENLVHLGLRNILIDCDLDQLNSVTDSIKRKINKIVVTTSRDLGDTNYLYKSINKINKDLISVLYPSRETKEDNCNFIESKTILKDYELLTGYNFNLYEANNAVYENILGRINNRDK